MNNSCNYFIYDKKNKVERQCKYSIKNNIEKNGIIILYCNKHNNHKNLSNILLDNTMNKNDTPQVIYSNTFSKEDKPIYSIKKVLIPFLHNNNFINNGYKISFLKLIDKLYPNYICEEQTFMESIKLYNKFLEMNECDDIDFYDKIIYYTISLCLCFKFYESEDTDYKEDRESKFDFNANKIFSKFCNIDVIKFNKYEIEFLKKIDYIIYI